MPEHDPEICGCSYVGNDMWSCGHIDNLPVDDVSYERLSAEDQISSED